MVRIGFSTQRRNVLSKLIRALTRSEVSHAWLLVEDSFFGVTMVMEATEVGFRLVPYDSFARQNYVVSVIEPKFDLTPGVQTAAQWLGNTYDFLGLFGTLFVLLGRAFKRRIRNPFHSRRAMFCSEAVVRVLQAANYPGAEAFDPEATTPQDLLDFFRSG